MTDRPTAPPDPTEAAELAAFEATQREGTWADRELARLQAEADNPDFQRGLVRVILPSD